MYSVRVEASKRKETGGEWQDDEVDFSALEEPESSSIRFSAGNPRVEHITGIVHLYREFSQQQATASAGAPMVHAPSTSASSKAKPAGLAAPTFAQTVAGTSPSTPQPAAASAVTAMVDTLCCLAIPGDMSVADFCNFCGAYLNNIREMRVLRREAAARVVCMVLVRFDTPEHAQSFYEDFNNKPFCSLEPEILCRLVHVKFVEMLERPERTATAPAMALSYTPNGSTAGTAGGSGGNGSGNGAAAGRSGGQASTSGSSSEIQPVEDRAAAAEASATSSARTGPSGSGGGVSANGVHSGRPADKQHRKGKGQQQQQQQHRHHQHTHSQPQQQQQQQQSAPSISSGPATGPVPSQGLGVTLLPPPAGSTELPSCPVCLERLDYHISGIVTTVCNHQFHSECLQKWGDTSCPVCRYCSQPGGMHASRCSVCSSAADLWICLICGHIGCGRYKAGHAFNHWESSQHCYALELETQRVWDYAGDNYVHRLIQSKTDGKLVEVPSPAVTSARGTHGVRHSRGSCGAGASDSRMPGVLEDDEDDYFGPEDEDFKEALISSKFDAIAADYNHLITTQLDSQRQYFESLLTAAAKEAEQRIAAAEADAASARKAAAEAAAFAKEADAKRQAADKKLVDVASTLQQVHKEKDILRSLNDSLLANQRDYQQQLAAAKAEVAAKAEANKDLQEQVRDLMVYIEAQRLVATSGEEGLHEATVLPVPEAQRGRAGGARHGRVRHGGASK